MSDAFARGEAASGYRLWTPGSLGEKHRSTGRAGGGEVTEAERIRNAARAEGFAAGYEEGKARARSEVERLASIATAAEHEVMTLQSTIAEDLLYLALDVARQVLRAEIDTRREAMLPAVREAIGAVGSSVQNPQLALNPGDLDLVRAHLGDELAAGGFRVIEDHRIEPGGCRVSGSNCEIDATLATRWKRVRAALGLQDERA